MGWYRQEGSRSNSGIVDKYFLVSSSRSCSFPGPVERFAMMAGGDRQPVPGSECATPGSCRDCRTEPGIAGVSPGCSGEGRQTARNHKKDRLFMVYTPALPGHYRHRRHDTPGGTGDAPGCDRSRCAWRSCKQGKPGGEVHCGSQLKPFPLGAPSSQHHSPQGHSFAHSFDKGIQFRCGFRTSV